MLPANLTARRRLVLLLALTWLALSLLVVELATRRAAGLPLLRWPLAVTVAWTLMSALACGAVLIESLRHAIRRWAALSDAEHFRRLLLLAALCLFFEWICLIAAA
jgi:hypothetical protein